ncbi:MAG: hydrogenase subunit MbhD domain-containing protein [Gammaproteobacteria bacterium]
MSDFMSAVLGGPEPVWLWLIDLLLAVAVAGLAWRALAAPRDVSDAAARGQRERVLLFMAFGLLLALVWARLGAPDVAIAEAAIGAGFAGALLLNALRDDEHCVEVPMGPGVSPAINLLTLGLGGALAWALWSVIGQEPRASLAGPVLRAVPETGVSNPVTSVLLNIRAWDTLLELAVLMAAALGIAGLAAGRASRARPSLVITGLLHWLVPALFVAAGYLLWVGAHAPGGAFQAGALLAAAGVIMHLGGAARAGLPPPRWQAWISVSGVGVFLLVGVGTLLYDGVLLGYRGEQAAQLILLIEGFATVSIGALLIQAYLGGRAREGGGRAHEGGVRAHEGGSQAREGKPS